MTGLLGWNGAVGLRVRRHGPPAVIPLLLVHGWPRDGSEWDAVAWLLAKNHRLICAELRGMGLSDRREEGHDAATQAGDLAAVLSGRDRVFLAQLMRRHGQRVASGRGASPPRAGCAAASRITGRSRPRPRRSSPGAGRA